MSAGGSRVVLHVLKVWLVATLATLTFWALVAGGFALFHQEWRDRLTGRVHPVTVTVVGDRATDHGCGKYRAWPGHDWLVTWDEGGTLRRGSWEKCPAAPSVGTRIDTLVTDDGHLGGDTTENYYIWWPIISAGMGAVLAAAWLFGRGRPRFEALRLSGG